jgi:hypothetical protein
MGSRMLKAKMSKITRIQVDLAIVILEEVNRRLKKKKI